MGSTVISEERANQLLEDKVKEIDQSIRSLVKVPLNQNQWNTLASFIYNVGEGAFSSSTLLKVLNKKEFDQVPNELKKWVHIGKKVSDGLKIRRLKEATLWSKKENNPLPSLSWLSRLLRKKVALK